MDERSAAAAGELAGGAYQGKGGLLITFFVVVSPSRQGCGEGRTFANFALNGDSAVM